MTTEQRRRETEELFRITPKGDPTVTVQTLPAPPAMAPSLANAGDPRMQWIIVTPELALSWLTHNVKNRPLTDGRVRLYAADMRENRWREDSPEPVMFDCDGLLVNGQHRLEAIIRAGRAIRMFVVTGVDPAVREVVDTGRARSASDILALRYELAGHDASSYTAALRVLYAWKLKPETGPINRNIVSGTLISTQHVQSLWPEYADSLKALLPVARGLTAAKIPGGTGLWLGLLVRLFEVGGEDARTFAERLASGAGLAVGDPILTLRNRLLDPSQKPGREALCRLIVLAWNHYRSGRRVTRLNAVLVRDGEKIGFPKPV